MLHLYWSNLRIATICDVAAADGDDDDDDIQDSAP